ncbi:MAG: hypothetical protein ACYC1E_10150, partial [Propionibacteriaceae bacterium]
LAKDPADRPDAASTLERLRDIAAHPDRDLVGPVARPLPAATAVLPAVPGDVARAGLPSAPSAFGPTTTAVLPASPGRPTATAVMPAATAVMPGSTAVMPPSTRVAPFDEAAAPFAGPPYPPPTTARVNGPQTYIPQPGVAPGPPFARPRKTRRRRNLRPLVWVLIVLLGALAFLLGTQAGVLTALLRGPVASSSVRPTSSSTTPAAPRTTATSSSPTASSTGLVLQAAVQGVSQVLASLPAGKSKDRLVADWSTVGAQVLRGDDASDHLDGFASKVQREVRTGGVSIPQAMAILAAVEAVRAAL